MAYNTTDLTDKKLLAILNASSECSAEFLAATRTILPFSLIIDGGNLLGIYGNPTDLTIPDTVTAVGAKALRYTNITSLTFAGATPPAFGAEWAPPNLTTITVPSGAKDAYDTVLPGFTDIVEEASSVFSTPITYTIADMPVLDDGVGQMYPNSTLPYVVGQEYTITGNFDNAPFSVIATYMDLSAMFSIPNAKGFAGLILVENGNDVIAMNLMDGVRVIAGSQFEQYNGSQITLQQYYAAVSTITISSITEVTE